MKKKVLLSMALASFLSAETIKLEKVLIESEKEAKTSKNITSQELEFTRQSDLGEMLSEVFPEITHVRSSQIGNDIILRGFKKDDINILIDGAKIYGACPNRMDPPAMHISSNQIKEVKVNEGPFDVANFGGIAGTIDVITKEPKEGFGGELSLYGGSFGYQKGALSLEGGNDKIKVLLGYSHESSEQYEDGDGNTLSEQVALVALNEGDKYINSNLDAYSRDTYNLKVISNLSENQKLTLSYFRDDADDVLYPAFSMDAQIDTTDSFNAEYSYKDFKVKFYYSQVEHEMGTEFRKIMVANPMLYRTHKVDSSIGGLKIENKFNISNFILTAGVDGSVRNWNGKCLSEPSRNFRQSRIPDVDTTNIALYSKLVKSMSDFDINFGVRLDRTKTEANKNLVLNSNNADPIKALYNTIDSEKEYNSVSANFITKYKMDNSNLFIGVGQSVRVPDAKEAYFIAGMPMDGKFMWSIKGNENLKETVNREIDTGYEYFGDNYSFKTTLFYSNLKDFIYAYKNAMNTLTFDNIDAKVYGLDMSYFRELTTNITLDASVAFQRGKKETLIKGQNDKDLAEIPPIKSRFALTYNDSKYLAMVELLSAGEQKNIDSDNGEKKIDCYSILNLKGGYNFNKRVSLNIGVDNLFDETYAVNNSYVGRGVISSIGSEPMVINEAGRNFYANLNYRF